MPIHDVKLDFNKSISLVNPVIVVRVGDADTQVLRAELYDNGLAYTPQGDMYLQIKRRDGGLVISSKMEQVRDNIYSVTIPPQSFCYHGEAKLAYVAEYMGGVTAQTTGNITLKVLPGTTDEEAIEYFDQMLFEIRNSIVDEEEDRKSAEAEREKAEAARQAAEKERASEFTKAQEQRQTAFEQAQSTRQSTFEQNESTRNDAENAREAAESQRVENENTRQAQEKEREAAEEKRQTAFEQAQTERSEQFEAEEQERAETFSQWEEAESTRQQNESYRQSEEIKRDNAEAERISAEETRESNESERKQYYENLKGQVEAGELNGATFTPSLDVSGLLSWQNDKNLNNPTPVNIKGPKGDTGEGLKLLGTYTTFEELEEAHPDNNNIGDAYTVQGHLWIWDNGWKDSGQLQGVKGDAGGYYIPSVSITGELSWQGSEEGMAPVSSSNIRGPQGPPGENATTTELSSTDAPGLLRQLSGKEDEVLLGNGEWGEYRGGGSSGPFWLEIDDNGDLYAYYDNALGAPNLELDEADGNLYAIFTVNE